MDSKKMIKQMQKGFTLVELLIVVIILAILAAIVVPQFASSTDDAKVSSLDSTLAAMRSSIALYKQQHNAYPGKAPSGATNPSGTAAGTACTALTGASGSGILDAEASFLDQLAFYSDAAGNTCTVGGTAFPFGPYLQKRAIPTNAINTQKTLEIVTTGDLTMAGTGANAGGWKYDTTSGKFIANDTNADTNSSTYDKH